MMLQYSTQRQEILHQLVTYLRTKVSSTKMALLQTFAEHYFRNLSEQDLASHSIKTLGSILLSHWDLIQGRKPSDPKVRVFNPDSDVDGWSSTHTIIQVSYDDIPFLVDSIRMEISREGFQIHYIIHFGGLRLKRNSSFKVIDILSVEDKVETGCSEAPIYIEIDRQTDPAVMESIRQAIERILGDIYVAVSDWQEMKNKVKDVLHDLEVSPPAFEKCELDESIDFLRWMLSNHFTFLGSRDYRLIGSGSNRALQAITGSGSGVLRDDRTGVGAYWQDDLPPKVRRLVLTKSIVMIAKTGILSTVHRSVYADYVGVKRFDKAGNLIGERRFLGLYTSTAYHSSPRYIPMLRRKVAKIIESFDYPVNSHNGKEVVHILETLPRDDLFESSHKQLFELTRGILQLQERRSIRLFVRKDAYDRYFSCIVYVPKDISSTELSLKMQDILIKAFHGSESSFTTLFSDSVLARLHYIVRLKSVKPVSFSVPLIEQQLRIAASSWADELKTRLIEDFGEARGLKYYTKYRKAFPSSYTEQYLPRTAIEDIRKIESLSEKHPLEMSFYKSGTATLQLKIFHTEHTIALSDVLPTLENFGLRVIGEQPHQVVFSNGSITSISDFDMVHASQREIDVENIRENFQEAFIRIWFRDAEDDGFNCLVISAGLTWHEVAVLRGFSRYMWQTGFTFSQAYIQQALVNNVVIARRLVELFKLRFSPEYTDENARPDTKPIIEWIQRALEEVSSLDEDRIIRRFLEVILATIRTNYFQTTNDGAFKSYISFKLDPEKISELPLPRPEYEIFVYSPRVEGVHLRAGKVARGGLRWSDRREDFRTEVLGLMKAQQVKNSVIVPVGAKGGFFPKRLPVDGNRDAIMREAIYCYTTFIRGLLDVTDNICDGKVILPKDVVRYDEDDPYLVVAADKGTSTFSDIANNVAADYNFWLGDAFASGGSAGYDHKKMGITARGAFESVKRHFRELGLNSDETDFTVVGIGDMSGDVFGNGMLLSRHIRLIAAYNHQHIFIDPTPDAETSFQERERLFGLPRSAWSDYNPALISSGGGVFSRFAKRIRITAEMQQAFGIVEDVLVPNDLIRAILQSPVDLIWNGGIGTFVKSSEETHTEVGDRTNDLIRIDGNQLRSRVVCEGGNLGLTQLGRIEYALTGGVLYTDFIDNSAGVDCSDHEVNIKILLNPLVSEGSMSLDERNSLLEKMTDEVTSLVLRDNYEQTQMVSLESSVAVQTMDIFRRYISGMEKEGRIDRAFEFLPDEKSLLERKVTGQSLTRPEIAVMLSYAKMFLKQDILQSDVPEDPWFLRFLITAFPPMLRKKYLPQMKKHSLRREIIATQLGKHITDRMGINFIERLQRETGASMSFVIRGYVTAADIFEIESLWRQIEEQDFNINTEVQQKMFLQVYYLVRRATRWILRNRKPGLNINKTIEYFLNSVKCLIVALPTLLPSSDKELLEQEVILLTGQGVAEGLARRIAVCNTLFTSLDIVEAAIKHDFSVSEVAKTYYELGCRLELNWLREQMNAYPIDNQWDELARSSFRDDLDRVQRKLAITVLYSGTGDTHSDSSERIDRWLETCQLLTGRWQNLLAEIRATQGAGFVTYSVVLRELFDFAEAG